MKTKTILLLSIVLFFGTTLVRAQASSPTIPPGKYTLEKDADYGKYETNIKEDVAWLLKNPLDKDADLRKQISAFITKWITGAPNVSVTMGSVSSPIVGQKDYKYNGDLLIAYMGGIAVFELNNPAEKDEAKIEAAGIEAILTLAANNTNLLKDSDAVKKYKGMKDKGELDKWIKDTIAKDKK